MPRSTQTTQSGRSPKSCCRCSRKSPRSPHRIALGGPGNVIARVVLIIHSILDSYNHTNALDLAHVVGFFLLGLKKVAPQYPLASSSARRALAPHRRRSFPL